MRKAGVSQYLLGALFALPLAAGCGSAVAPTRLGASDRPLVGGTVNVVVLENANPQSHLLRTLDDAIRTADRRRSLLEKQKMPADLLRERAPESPQAVEFRQRNEETMQAARLDSLETEIVGTLDSRLRLADEQRLAAERVRLASSVEVEFQSRADQIDDEAEASENAVAAQDRDASVNLRAKISALKENIQPPPTAPDDYWGHRLTARQAELDTLNAQRQALVAEIRATRRSRRQSLLALLNAAADHQLATVASSGVKKRGQVLDAAEARLDKQSADILTSAKALDSEALAATETAQSQSGGREQASWTYRAMPASFEGGIGREGLAALRAERTRLARRIADQTMQAAAEIAREHGIAIVGYGRRDGTPDITPTVLKMLREDRWG